ncbi:MAG: DUF2500 domain-containing protein [Defluviitaleaceae bacterium]|nr:DUF2500 domain-containing protein [Defluviitaleaceae bacterium]
MIIFIIFVIGACMYQFSLWIRDIFKLLSSIEAKIIEIDYRQSKEYRNGRPNIIPVYRVTFSLPDDTKKIFDILVWHYKWIAIGDIDILTTQGKSFVKFKKLENVLDNSEECEKQEVHLPIKNKEKKLSLSDSMK